MFREIILEKKMIITQNRSPRIRAIYITLHLNQRRQMENLSSNDLNQKLMFLAAKQARIDKGRDDLYRDRKFAQQYQAYTARKENNQTPTEEQIQARDYLRDEYDGFFDGEADSESDSEVEATPEAKERKQAGKLYTHFKQELIANSVERKKVNLVGRAIAKILEDRSNNSVAESSGASNSAVVQESATSSKNEELNTETASQVNQSPSDYIDSLPKDYNPFDDIGED